MATFAQMCESVPHEDIDDLCLTQAQIDEFCEKNRNSFTVTTLFLFKKKINPLKRVLRWLMKLIFRREIKRRIFVAVMRPCYETPERVSIRAEVEHFESTTVWGGYHPYRLVVRVADVATLVP
jgi:hypothetical protein